METIKIRLDTSVLDNVLYTYVPMAYDTGVTYAEGYSMVPDDSEVDADSPEYICVSNVIFTSTTEDTSGETQTGYYKKESYITSEYLKFVVPTFNSFETNLYQEELINDLFVNDIKAGVIPNLIDMEKVVFTPAYESNGVIYDAMEIVYNFHFCERDVKDGWKVKDTTSWNGIPLNTKLTTQNLRKSDKLGYLGFTNDDVRFQTNKLKRSFVRLAYYTSKNPLDQKLLTYNTMFIDTGELFGKFMNNRVDDETFGVNSDYEPDSTNSNRLDSRLTVVDKNNIDKSSEGFYLYLFNDEVTEKKPQKDIYMKVEFNSAKYGLTVPVGKPYFDINNAEIKLMPFDEFFNSIFIKIRLKYIDSEKRFVYIVPEDGITTQVDEQNRRIIFNLFEVKFEE